MSTDTADQLLADALAYHGRGWPVVPILSSRGVDDKGSKRPLVKYGRFVQGTQTTAQVRQLFGARSRANGIGVIAGTRTGGGLAVRDFDTTDGYDQFRARLPAFARSAPTVRTRRGFHVWCRSDHANVVKLGDGEYRGAGIVLAPHSAHYDGGRYEWINPLSPDLPFIESNQLIDRKAPENVTETAECHVSVFSALSVLSVTSAAEVIAATLPTKPGERNACILNLARGLKLNLGITDKVALREHVREWHAKALPFIDTKDAGVSWADFLHAYERAQHPLGMDLVDAAALRVDPDHLPDAAADYDGLATRQLVGLCHALAQVNGDGGRFFLSTHDAAPRVNLTPMQVWRLLRVLESDGVIEQLEKGNARRATRYRWKGGT